MHNDCAKMKISYVEISQKSNVELLYERPLLCILPHHYIYIQTFERKCSTQKVEERTQHSTHQVQNKNHKLGCLVCKNGC